MKIPSAIWPCCYHKSAALTSLSAAHCDGGSPSKPAQAEFVHSLQLLLSRRLQVRVIKDSTSTTVEEAGPSVAALVVGLNSVPVAGDEFTVMETEQEVRGKSASQLLVLLSMRAIELRTACHPCFFQVDTALIVS